LNPKILLVGYNGANNTGAEAKLNAIINDVRSVFGPQVHITVPSLNIENLRRYLKESEYLHIAPVRPSTFFIDAYRLVKKNDLIMIVEGSCYMDTWSPALLWYYLLNTKYAYDLNKLCIGYSVDAGSASRFNRWLIRREASKTDLILARTQAAANRLKDWGVSAPIEVTADNAFAFQANSADEGLLGQVWPEATNVVGIAAENIYLWPAVIQLWGPRKFCYRWPYYYNHSPDSLKKGELLANVLACQADEIVEKYDKHVALLGMEGLDTTFVHKVHGIMTHAKRARVFTSAEYNASQMTCLLRSLDLLITSRYHAGVLSLAKPIPQTAIGHDLRIKDLYADLGIAEFFVDHEDPNRYKILSDNVEHLLCNPEKVKEKLRLGYERYLKKEKCNATLLRTFIENHKPEWLP
jgi:polysaccharide pyruvyl transferase WcaK-like protein